MLIQVETICPFCGHTNIIMVDENDYLDWKDGKLAQDAFWYLDPDEREMLISGVCPKCWDNMISVETEEEEEDDDWEDAAWHDTCDWEEDFSDEIGFDPYLGGYTWDC